MMKVEKIQRVLKTGKIAHAARVWQSRLADTRVGVTLARAVRRC
jgi:hypothetical protein